MSWEEKTKMKQREEFVKMAIQESANIKELCRKYNISRKSGYKWIQRFKETGNCEERSRKPHHSPKATQKKIEDKIVILRQKHPTWGGRKIRARLVQTGNKDIPSAPSISKILKRNGLITTHPHKSTNAWTRFEHENANDLWQMDFKGHFLMDDGNRCHPLTILDDHSRFCVCLKACANELGQTVKEALIEVFMRYGLPVRINCDNGAPWGSSNKDVLYTSFSIWLMTFGIRISHSRPHHPQSNGKDERFHRTLKYDFLERNSVKNLAHSQISFDHWLYSYNHERPHEALALQTPAARYQPGQRDFCGRIPTLFYDKSFIERNVDSKGYIYFDGYKFSVGLAFKKLTLGVKYIADSVIEIFFYNQKIACFDLSLLKKYEKAYGIYRSENRFLSA